MKGIRIYPIGQSIISAGCFPIVAKSFTYVRDVTKSALEEILLKENAVLLSVFEGKLNYSIFLTQDEYEAIRQAGQLDDYINTVIKKMDSYKSALIAETAAYASSINRSRRVVD